MKKFTSRSKVRILCSALPLVAAALSLTSGKAAYALDIHVSHAGTDHTAAIQAALSNPAYSRVILDYYSTGWTTLPLNMNVPNQELWIAGSGSTPGILRAKQGYPAFSATNACLIRSSVTGSVINGYADGVNLSSGRATLEMRKADYQNAAIYAPSEGRHGLHISGDNVVIKGIIVKNTGGDGVYLSKANNGTVTNVICDGAHRNGLTVVQADTLSVTSSLFKNTSGTAPEAGIDIEPNYPHNTLDNITFTDCTSINNEGLQVQVGIAKLTGPNPVIPTISVRFYNLVVDGTGGDDSCIKVSAMQPDGPATGMIYFQNTTISDSFKHGLLVQAWAADRARVVFNRGTINNASAGAAESAFGPIGITAGGATYTVGEVQFQNAWRIDDYNSGRNRLIGGSSTPGYKDITSTVPIDVKRHYTNTTNPVIFSSPVPLNNVTISANLLP
jgi:hypothetical protein